MHDLIETIATRAEADREKILSSLRAYIAEGKSGEEAVQALFAKTAEELGRTVSFHDYSPSDVELIEEFAGVMYLALVVSRLIAMSVSRR